LDTVTPSTLITFIWTTVRLKQLSHSNERNERNFQNTADIQTFSIIVDDLTDDTEAKKSVI